MTAAIRAALDIEFERHEHEREQLERRGRTLGEIAALLRRLDADDDPSASANTPPPKPSPPPSSVAAPEPPAPTPPGVEGRPTYEEVRRYVVSNGPVAYGAIRDAVGGSNSAVLRRLRRLAADGAIAVEGRPPHRRYGAPVADSGTASEAPLAATVSCEDHEQLLSLIRDNAPVTSARLRELTGCGFGQLLEWGRVLARRRDVTFDGDGPDRVWRPAEERTMTSEVLAAVTADPGALNERRIALALRAKYAQVVHACAELLDSGAVTLTDNNTYLPAQPLGATGTER